MILVIVGHEHQNLAEPHKIPGAQAHVPGHLAMFAPPIVKHQQRILHGHGEARIVIIGDRRNIRHEGLLVMIN